MPTNLPQHRVHQVPAPGGHVEQPQADKTGHLDVVWDVHVGRGGREEGADVQRHQGGEVGVTATTSGGGWGRGVSLRCCGGYTHTIARATQPTLQLTFPGIFPECTFHFSAERTHAQY